MLGRHRLLMVGVGVGVVVALVASVSPASASAARPTMDVRLAVVSSPGPSASAATPIPTNFCNFGFERLRSCKVETRNVAIFDTLNGAERGRITYKVVDRIELNAFGSSWTHDITFLVTGVQATDQLAASVLSQTVITGTFTCLERDSANGASIPCSGFGSFGETPFSQVPNQAFGVGQAISVVNLQQGKIVTDTGRWDFTFINRATRNRITSDVVFSRGHRCDSTLPEPVGGGGCADNLITPIFFMNSSAYPTVARHVRNAIGNGVPAVLNRTTNGSIQADNTRTACPSPSNTPGLAADALVRPIVNGVKFTCDEYPFASTLQGAADPLNGATAAERRTVGRQFFNFNLSNGETFQCRIPLGPVAGRPDKIFYPKREGGNRRGFNACMVPELENSRAGGDLSAFYTGNRIINDDQFQVFA